MHTEKEGNTKGCTMETTTLSKYCFFYLLYPLSRHQEEARGVNLGHFHIIWVQMNLDCHLVRC